VFYVTLIHEGASSFLSIASVKTPVVSCYFFANPHIFDPINVRMKLIIALNEMGNYLGWT